MRALIDTNVIIDSLQSRDGFLEDAAEVMLRADEYDGYIAASSVADIFYLQQRFFHDKKKARENLLDLLKLFVIIDTTAEDCKSALRDGVVDFEDAILVESAAREGMDVIVTRNQKDFEDAFIEVCSPAEFIEKLKKK